MREWAKPVSLEQRCSDTARASVLDGYYIEIEQISRRENDVVRVVSRLKRVNSVSSPSPSCSLISVRLRVQRVRILPERSIIRRLFDSMYTLEPRSNMKALIGVVWASAALEVYTVAGEARVYTSESWSYQKPKEPPSISPHTARLLLAQRLGLSQYHSLQDADEPTLDILNTYGGEQQQIFVHEERSQGAEKLLLVVEGVDEGSL